MAKFCIGTTFLIIAIYIAEFYPTKIRVAGLAMVGVLARIGGVMSPTFSTLLSDADVHLPYLVFAIMNFVALVSVWFLD